MYKSVQKTYGFHEIYANYCTKVYKKLMFVLRHIGLIFTTILQEKVQTQKFKK